MTVRRLDRGNTHCRSSRLAEQILQLGEIRRHAAGLVLAEQLGGRAPTLGAAPHCEGRARVRRMVGRHTAYRTPQ
jgi:hypothetical protein